MFKTVIKMLCDSKNLPRIMLICKEMYTLVFATKPKIEQFRKEKEKKKKKKSSLEKGLLIFKLVYP